MDCMEIRGKLIDYIDDNLEDAEKEEIRLHIEGCTECEKEYEEILEAAHYVQQGFEKISVPHGFMDDVKNSIKQSAVKRFRIKKPLKTIFIAAALIILFTITAFAAGGFDFLKWWQEKSIKESKSIEELIASGYGENVNVSAQDKNIKFTIENVVADDTCTILSYSIEDLNKEKKYMLNDHMKGDLIEGEFIYHFEQVKNPYIADTILYSDIPYVQKGMIRLEPIMAENSRITITINKLQYGDKKPISSVDGSWKLNIPITKHKAKTYTLNKEVDIDGNKVIFKEIKIAPTNTALTFSYDESQKGYNIGGFYDIKLIADGKQYMPKYMGAGSYKSIKSYNEVTLEFDSMYLDNPDKVNVFVGGYTANVHQYAYYDINVNKPFPQVFEYFGSKISIDDIKIGEDKTEVTMSQIFGENRYENINVEFGVKGHSLAYSSYNREQKIVFDKKGREIDLKDMEDAKIKKLEPKIYFTKQLFTIEDPPGIEKIPKEYHTGKLIPIQLKVWGYQETRYVNESFTIKYDDWKN